MISFPLQQGLFQYDVMDHHALLGTPLDASPQEIRQAYLKVAYRLHPDTCRAQTDKDKNLASKLFSKLVNPAYEVLSRNSSCTEHLLICSQTARNALGDRDQLVRLNEHTQKLWAAKNNPELVYRQILQVLARELYSDLSCVFPAVARISEVNLVFLLLKVDNPISSKPAAKVASRTIVVQGFTPSSEPPAPAPKIPPQELHLRRANEYYDKKQYNQAISELREVLKIAPKNSEAHCLIGLAYLYSNMSTMAKVHLKTAQELDPQNPRVILAKRELDKHSTAGDRHTDSKGSKGTFLGGLFGGKKK